MKRLVTFSLVVLLFQLLEVLNIGWRNGLRLFVDPNRSGFLRRIPAGDDGWFGYLQQAILKINKYP